eukprot:592562-Prorocentrum_minimum.AAC.1
MRGGGPPPRFQRRWTPSLPGSLGNGSPAAACRASPSCGRRALQGGTQVLHRCYTELVHPRVDTC